MTASDPSRRPPPPIPLTLLTGFLGAGKTTLLNALLRDPDLRDTAVLINEFGEIALDHLLVEKIDGDMMVLSSGCLCCNLRGDLVTALEKLLRNLDNGRASFKRVIVETTGLADPAPLLQTADAASLSGDALSARRRRDTGRRGERVQHARQSSRSGEAGCGRGSYRADQDRSARSGRRSGQARRPDRAAAQAQSGSSDPRCRRRRGPRDRHHRLRTLRPGPQDSGCIALACR